MVDQTITGCDPMPGNVDHADVVSLDPTHGVGTYSGGQHFTLTFDGCPLCMEESTTRTTGTIDWSKDTSGQSNSNSLQSRLNGLVNIAGDASDNGVKGVAVTRSDYNSATNEGYVFSITFQGNLVPGNVPLLVVGDNNLGGVSTSDGSISISIANQQEGYRPGFKLVYDSDRTGCIAWDEGGDTSTVGVEARLEALTGITDIANVTKLSLIHI